MASADAVWANYSFTVKPGAEAKLEKAVRDYFDGNAAFTGKVFFNRQVMNGADPSTHNIAILQPSVSAGWKELQRSQSDPKFQALAQLFAQNAQSVDESLLTHVKGYGEIKGEGNKFMTFAISVSSPARLIQALDKAFAQEGSWTLSGPLDVFAIAAGGAPGISHIVVVGYEMTLRPSQDYLRSANYTELQKSLNRVREIRPVLGWLKISFFKDRLT